MPCVCVMGTSPDARGGIATVVREFHGGFAHPGYDFSYIVSHDDLPAIPKTWLGLKAAWRLRKLCQSKAVDLLHLHSADGASFTRAQLYIAIANRYHVPVINHIHAASWENFYVHASESKRKQISKAYSNCAALIALSSACEHDLAEAAPEHRIYVLENFIPYAEPDHRPSFERRQITLISRIESVKGTDILPDIIRLTVNKLPDASFVICGEGSQLQKMKDDCSNLGLDSQQVRFLGWVDANQRKDILRASSLYLLPSYAEGMPMSILEGVGFNLPIVSTPVGGIPSIVHDGENGILCEPGDAAEFAEAIVALLTSRERYETMVEGSKSMAANHSLPKYGEELCAIYDSVLTASVQI